MESQNFMIQANALVLVGHYFQFSLIYILDELFSELFPPHESFILKKKELCLKKLRFLTESAAAASARICFVFSLKHFQVRFANSVFDISFKIIFKFREIAASETSDTCR